MTKVSWDHFAGRAWEHDLGENNWSALPVSAETHRLEWSSSLVPKWNSVILKADCLAKNSTPKQLPPVSIIIKPLECIFISGIRKYTSSPIYLHFPFLSLRLQLSRHSQVSVQFLFPKPPLSVVQRMGTAPDLHQKLLIQMCGWGQGKGWGGEENIQRRDRAKGKRGEAEQGERRAGLRGLGKCRKVRKGACRRRGWGENEREHGGGEKEEGVGNGEILWKVEMIKRKKFE